MSNSGNVFQEPAKDREQEEGTVFRPKFGADGLVTVVTRDAGTGDVLMVAHMNSEALERTLKTGTVHYWSRSRNAIWIKGETSGNTQKLVEMRTDCDQDALVVTVSQQGAGVACHTGRFTCFYRRVAQEDNGSVRLVADED